MMDHSLCYKKGNNEEGYHPRLLVGCPGFVSSRNSENHQGIRAHSGVQDPKTPEGPALSHRAADTADTACI